MKKIEIHGLEYAVCKVLVFLNYLFRDKVEGWVIDRNRLTVQVVSFLDKSEATVLLKPSNWPERSFIRCWFSYKHSALLENSGWYAETISIEALHLKDFSNDAFVFAFNWDPSNLINAGSIRREGGEKIKSIVGSYGKHDIEKILAY